MTTWTEFNDMNTHGFQKLAYKRIWIEAEEHEATGIFNDLFNYSPLRTTCECCGQDFWISEETTPQFEEGDAVIYASNVTQVTVYSKPKPEQSKLKLSLTFFSDPGHGWLRVPLKTLIALDLVDQITPFSYVNLNSKRAYCYLEEDCDYSTFNKALEERGITPKISHRSANDESSIRTYWPFNQQNIDWARQYLIHE